MGINVNFSDWRNEKLLHINNYISDSILSRTETPDPLKKAMLYATQGGGKRIRPLLTMATGEILDIQPEVLVPLACSVELIHAYSLVHDDLPGIDNDNFRRGRPSLHKAFDEGLAIITGDALQSLAYQCLIQIQPYTTETELILDALEIILSSAGPEGMVGGQSLDLYNQHDLNEQDLMNMYRMKTGLLIESSVELPCIFAKNFDLEKKALLNCGKALGKMFQLRDDLMELTDDATSLGTPVDSDIKNGKRTYPAVFGLSKCKERLLAIHNYIDDQLKTTGLQSSSFASIIDSLKLDLS